MYGSTSTSDFQTLDLDDCRPAAIRRHKIHLWRSMKVMISSRLFLGFSLIFALMMIVYQRMSIVNLQKSLDETPRGRRSLYSSENEIRDDYLPIYAEMTKSQLKHLCEKHSITIGFEAKKHRKKSHSDRKHCQVDVSMTAPRLVTKRPHSIGAALRGWEILVAI
ncbi:unnamed protein product, partial [Mesorhabditis belari]|uniref:Uncharacterized protein n=1 Tax=Mesorhabditis belari TaxID=2138241 RepID=A0AAF3EWL4_9BILA